MHHSAGKKFKQAVAAHQPLQVIGTINAYCAMMAAQAGVKAIYLSGAGVANNSYGLPDLGITSLNDVLADVSRITSATDLPLLVDADTGWGNAFNIARTVTEMIKAGAAGIHLEDQVQAKRCGHRPHKEIVSLSEMVDRVKTAVDARSDNDFVIMARTDAYAIEGLDAALERAQACVAAGADMIFPEAMHDLSEYQRFTSALNVPVLANITEFGKTPLFTREQLASVGVAIILYPLSASRAMNAAALKTFQTIIQDGTQAPLLQQMQTREELYEFLHYYQYEAQLDRITQEHKA